MVFPDKNIRPLPFPLAYKNFPSACRDRSLGLIFALLGAWGVFVFSSRKKRLSGF